MRIEFAHTPKHTRFSTSFFFAMLFVYCSAAVLLPYLGNFSSLTMFTPERLLQKLVDGFRAPPLSLSSRGSGVPFQELCPAVQGL